MNDNPLMFSVDTVWHVVEWLLGIVGFLVIFVGMILIRKLDEHKELFERIFPRLEALEKQMVRVETVGDATGQFRAYSEAWDISKGDRRLNSRRSRDD